MKEFFDNLELFPYVYEVTKELSKRYELYIVSIGTLSNLQYKSEYIRHRLPFIDNVVLIYNKECKMNKAIVNCPEDSIFMDDVVSNLDSVNSRHKYIYGIEKPWNTEGNQYKRLYNFIDVANEFLK
jgi:5'(3')-deoxyribonucleotidase